MNEQEPTSEQIIKDVPDEDSLKIQVINIENLVNGICTEKENIEKKFEDSIITKQEYYENLFALSKQAVKLHDVVIKAKNGIVESVFLEVLIDNENWAKEIYEHLVSNHIDQIEIKLETNSGEYEKYINKINTILDGKTFIKSELLIELAMANKYYVTLEENVNDIIKVNNVFGDNEQINLLKTFLGDLKEKIKYLNSEVLKLCN